MTKVRNVAASNAIQGRLYDHEYNGKLKRFMCMRIKGEEACLITKSGGLMLWTPPETILSELPEGADWDWKPEETSVEKLGEVWRKLGRLATERSIVRSVTAHQYKEGDWIKPPQGEYQKITGLGESGDDPMVFVHDTPYSPNQVTPVHFRPFKNAAEFSKHKDRWILLRGWPARVISFDDRIADVGRNNKLTWGDLIRYGVFDDNGWPVGVPVEEAPE